MLRELCAAAFGAHAPGVEVYDGDTAMARAPEQARWLQPCEIRNRSVVCESDRMPSVLRCCHVEAPHPALHAPSG